MDTFHIITLVLAFLFIIAIVQGNYNVTIFIILFLAFIFFTKKG
jgi:hypothetical protein